MRRSEEGDYAAQTQTCAAIEDEADSCVATLGSPSAAFLDEIR